MNKTVNIIMIVLLSIITVAVIGFFIYLMNGNTFSWNFGFNSYSQNLLESKEVDSISQINVDAKNTDVLVERSTNNKIVVELYSDNNVEHKIEVNNNIMYINYYDNVGFRLFKKGNRVLIKLPDAFEDEFIVKLTTGDVKIGSFEKLSPEINLGTGDIKAEKLKDLNIESTTGDVKINTLEKINCKHSTGDVKIEKVGVANIHSSTGDIKLNEVTNSVDISLTTGDVKISKATINEDSNISLTTGDVKIASCEGAYIEASNSVGDIRVNNNDRKLEKTLKISGKIGDIRVN